MATKHTPGPWRTGGTTASVYREGTDIPIAHTSKFNKEEEEREANARLIAAAPELLEAAKEVAEWHEMIKQNYPECSGLLTAIYKAEAAIARAEGNPDHEHTGEPDPSDLYREWKDAQDDADQPTLYDP